MATWKFDATQRFGQYHGALYKAGDIAPNLGGQPAQASAEALTAYLQTQLDAHQLEEETDYVIWRNVSYEDFDQLLKAVRLATY